MNDEELKMVRMVEWMKEVGLPVTLSQAQRILTGKSVKGARKDDRQELLNYKEAMDFVSEYRGKKSEITEDLIK